MCDSREDIVPTLNAGLLRVSADGVARIRLTRGRSSGKLRSLRHALALYRVARHPGRPARHTHVRVAPAVRVLAEAVARRGIATATIMIARRPALETPRRGVLRKSLCICAAPKHPIAQPRHWQARVWAIDTRRPAEMHTHGMPVQRLGNSAAGAAGYRPRS
jgi:hypothetical protein